MGVVTHSNRTMVLVALGYNPPPLFLKHWQPGLTALYPVKMDVVVGSPPEKTRLRSL